MNSKFTLALIALVGVGVFALPSTMALFAGQHSFYNIDATGNQVPCVKCHGDVKAELSSGGSTLTGTAGPHANFKCEYCHRSEAGMSSGDDAYAKITYSNGSGGSIYLVTTIQNFETGNFPKIITYQSSMTVDNWAGNIYSTDGSAFTVRGEFNDSLGKYSGSLSTVGNAGTNYTYSYSSETATYSGGAPKDTNAGTRNTAFNASAVTWDVNGKNESLVGAGSREVTPGTRYHAASLVSCLECHGGEQKKGVTGYEIDTAEPYNHAGWLINKEDPSSACSNCHYGDQSASHTPAFEASLEAGGFNLTTAPGDTGETEAHNNFVRGANDGSKDILRNGYGGANDACVACHTHVAVDINFTKRYALKFDAVAQKQSPTENSTWKIGGFSAKGDVKVEEFGNGTGGAFATGNHSYTWTPDSTLYLINGTAGNGSVIGQVQSLNNEPSDSASALVSP